jgi:hypothetical protein
VSAGKRMGRAAAFPVLRLVEPRFADLVRLLTDTRQAVHDEAAATRKSIADFEPMLASYAASSGESLTFVGTQLRELADELRARNARPLTALFPDAEERARLKETGASVVMVLAAGDAEEQLAGWTVEERREAAGVVLVTARAG